MVAISGALLHVSPASAQQQSGTIRNTYGEVGILDMPSGHVAPDGQLAFSMGDVGVYQRYSLSFQALPWLETSFRYSHLPDWSLAQPKYYDRSFGIKIRLLKESDDLPDISLGIRDLLGTGVYSSEYLAASKQIGDLDFTAGLGWGRLADNNTLPNPFGAAFHSFKTRSAGTSGLVDFGQYFHGPKTGVFGGFAWQTPVDGLKLLAEYSSDKYTHEAQFPGNLIVRSSVNVGLSYRPYDSLALSAGWFYGTTYGFTVSFNGDPTTTAPSAMRLGPKVPPPAIRTDAEQQSALLNLHARSALIVGEQADRPWVNVQTTTEHVRQNLLQALLSEGRGVRDVDVQGKSVFVDAKITGSAGTQCAKYAQIASAARIDISSFAMTDLQNPDGVVTFCSIAKDEYHLAEASPTMRAYHRTDATDLTRFENDLRASMATQSLSLDAISVGNSELWLYFENYRYREESEAIGRIARLLMADAPPSIEIFHLISTINGIPMQQVTISRSALERTNEASGTAIEHGDAIKISAPPLANPVLDKVAPNLYPRFYWSIAPKVTEHLFDPDKPLQFQIYADVEGAVAVAPGLALGLGLTGNLYNDYTFGRPAGSDLPHVRTDLLQYIEHGSYGISYLNAVYKTRLSRDVFAEATGGYLEDMYMGGGAQVLWRPEGQRFAIGVDLYQVWKRDFNRLFGAQNYNILTGHASIYYQSPWYGLNFNVHAGRYLAGDYGATFEVTRRFATGVEIGAFATFTNVPFSRFGEGSFDKGIMIHIPFDWSLPIHSQSAFDLLLRSLTRDGGQRLAGDDSLYEETRGTSYGDIAEHFDDLVEP